MKPLFEEYLKTRRLYHLKHVDRGTPVRDRSESSAEHSWSCLILADMLLTAHDFGVDRLKVYELLMYHDVVEIEAGDVLATDTEGRKGKEERELEAMHSLSTQIPSHMKEKYIALFQEYEDCETREAKFAKAVDKLDAQLHELEYPEDWKGWTETFIRGYMGKYMKEFPKLNDIFEEMIGYLYKHQYIES